MEDLRDFLEYLLDAPTIQVVLEQFHGRVSIGIQKVGDQSNVLLAGSLQCDLPDVATFGMIGCSNPAPFLEEGSALSIDSRLYGSFWVSVETDLGMAADQE